MIYIVVNNFCIHYNYHLYIILNNKRNLEEVVYQKLLDMKGKHQIMNMIYII